MQRKANNIDKLRENGQESSWTRQLNTCQTIDQNNEKNKLQKVNSPITAQQICINFFEQKKLIHLYKGIDFELTFLVKKS